MAIRDVVAMMTLACVAAVCWGCVAGGTGGVAREDGPGVRRVILVRHGEKLDDGGEDPGLSEAGRAWGAELARYCAGQGVTGVVATPYRRTIETAWSTAEAVGARLAIVPASGGVGAHADAVARVIEGDAKGGNWLVVGHSNTVPAIIERLGGRGVGGVTIGESEYGRVFVLEFGGRGGVVLREGVVMNGDLVLSSGADDGV